jgi:hypothetical protein
MPHPLNQPAEQPANRGKQSKSYKKQARFDDSVIVPPHSFANAYKSDPTQKSRYPIKIQAAKVNQRHFDIAFIRSNNLPLTDNLFKEIYPLCFFGMHIY